MRQIIRRSAVLDFWVKLSRSPWALAWKALGAKLGISFPCSGHAIRFRMEAEDR